MKPKFILIILFIISFIQYSNELFQDNILKKIIEKNENLNIIISPLGIYQLLNILSNGAEGNTQKEILKILFQNQKLDDDKVLLNKVNNNIIEILTNISKEESSNLKEKEYQKNLKISNTSNKNIDPYCININGLFINNKYLVSNEFSKFCQNLNTSINEFIETKQINEFYFNKTNGKIKEIIHKIEKDADFILINAIYFRGIWHKPFNKEKTEKMPFLNINNDIVQVDTMFNFYKDIMYYKDEKVEIISLPYISKNIKFKFVIVLPNQNKYFSPLYYIKKEKININELISKLKLTKLVNLLLPKFNFEFGISLKQILKEMNMGKTFSNNEDFSKIFNAKSIKVNDIIQKTFIKINEEGTDSELVPSINEIYFSDNNYQNSIYMYVNHSFIFTIVSEEIKDPKGNYLIPFIGVVNNLKGEFIKETKNNNFNNSLYLNLKRALIRINYKDNLTNMSIKASPPLRNNSDNEIKNSSTNFEYNIKYNKINIIIFIILFMMISI